MYTYKLLHIDKYWGFDENNRRVILTIYTEEKLDLNNINEKLSSSDQVLKYMTLDYLKNMSIEMIFPVTRRHIKLKLILDV